MRLTIVPGDNTVIVDGEGKNLDLSRYIELKGVHAVQWDGEKGHVEYKDKPIENIVTIGQYQTIVDAWKRAEAKEPPHAQQQPQASPNHGGSSPQPAIRKEGGYTTVRGERVQSGGRQDGNSTQKEEEGTVRRRL